MPETKAYLDDKAIQKKLKDGWIRSWMMIEVLAASEDAAKNSLRLHVEKIQKEKNTEFIKTVFHETKKQETPNLPIPVAHSCIVEVEFLAGTYDTLAYIAMNYAPSAIEIWDPKKLTLNAGEAQSVLNSIADLVHTFAARGVGGVVIKT